MTPQILTHTDPSQPNVRWLVLNRPEARNAWTDEMITGFVSAVDAAGADSTVHALIITGAGDAFSAGGDLKAMRDKVGMFAGNPVELRDRYTRGIQSIPRAMARFEKPAIAAINGPAIGAGLDLACMCDVRVSADSARFGSTFVRVGLIPGDGGAYLLSRTIGFPRALELILTGRVIDAIEAQQMGLIGQIVPAADLHASALKMAAALTRAAPLAVRLAKAATYRAWDAGLEQALDLAATYQGIVQNTDDHLEGVAALLERRPPVFTGQ